MLNNKNSLMKIKSFILTVLLIIGGTSVANAQLTTAEPTARVVRSGNRAQQGNFGIYLGATSNMLGKIGNKNLTSIAPLPLINFKYMSSNNFEWRIGLEAYHYSEHIDGKVEDVGLILEEYGESQVMLTPGFAHHFSRLNLLDVYIGMEFPIGWIANKTLSKNPPTLLVQNSKSAFVIGAGAFIGVQAFIADLPLALGLEYGISARLDGGLKYKSLVNNAGTVTIEYHRDPSAFKHVSMDETFVDALSARKGEIFNQLRVTLSYYFK